MQIAIYDKLGLCYDGTTPEKRGLGGSESAAVYMSRELFKLGYSVTIYNDCTADDAMRGNHDGVKYVPRDKFGYVIPDIFISMRSVAPFFDFQEKLKGCYKVLWMHDTFCDGDIQLESMCLNGQIDKIFTLSDWHSLYASTADHGNRRMPEVMKRFIFQTRNGIINRIPWVDVAKKDYNHFVYNASYTKGMKPLVEQVWPRVKEKIPNAHLTVIGGFYRFRSDHGPDQQEKDWEALKQKHTNSGINFTGVITQQEIADTLAKASWMIYPADFPETFGISTLEALAYNVPVLTCNFGALEETAIDAACYKIPYSVTPNSLFPRINQEDQVNKFVEMTVAAYNNPYLHQQKQYACNIVKDICTWDTVAAQWDQHFNRVLGKYMSADAYQKVKRINQRVHEVFGRRTCNVEDNVVPIWGKERKIVVVIPTYNAEKYIAKCLDSVFAQDYENYDVIVIDDCSTDKTKDILKDYEARLTAVIYNSERCGSAVENQVRVINQYSHWSLSSNIIMLLDGDDALTNDPNIFRKYCNWHEDYDFTYGSCWSMVDNIPLQAQEYPPEVKANKSYRQHKFSWNMPYTHLRTFKSSLFWKINLKDLQDSNSKYYGPGGDGALFYALIEKCDPNRIKAVADIVYLYNDINPINDYKVNGKVQTMNANEILKINVPNMFNEINKIHLFTIVIPTMWKCNGLFFQALEEYVKHPLVDEILIIDNDPEFRWHNRQACVRHLSHPKIRVLTQTENIGVNPAWNLGVKEARNKLINIVNDDFKYDMNLLYRLQDKAQSLAKGDVYGIVAGEAKFGQPVATDYSISFKEFEGKSSSVGLHNFGQCMFVHKDHWVDIVYGLRIFYGDDFICARTQKAGHKIVMIYNIVWESPMAQTTGKIPEDERYRILTEELKVYNDWHSPAASADGGTWTMSPEVLESFVVDSVDPVEGLLAEFEKAKNESGSDISEHLDTLYHYAQLCEHVTELGVRWGQSTRAFLPAGIKKYVGYDLYADEKAMSVIRMANLAGINSKIIIDDTRTTTIEQTDLLFIDSDHNYKHLLTELNKHHAFVNYYIIMHDTQTYGVINDPVKPGEVGLLPACITFMMEHPEWEFDKIATNNNGLLVLKRKDPQQQIQVVDNKKKFSVVIPTIWKSLDLFRESLKRLIAHPLVGEIVVVDNAKENAPDWSELKNPKVNLIKTIKNLGCNGGWNTGVAHSIHDLLCVANDDLYFDTKVFDKLQNRLTPADGMYGITLGDEKCGQKPPTDYSIDFEMWFPPKDIVNFGELFFLHRDNWVPIPEQLVQGYGDYFLMWNQLNNDKPVWLITNILQVRADRVNGSLGASNATLSTEEHQRSTAAELPWYKNWATPVLSKWAAKMADNSRWAMQFVDGGTRTEQHGPVKNILIAIPTAKYIEPETMKSIYDLKIPAGYKVNFQFFFGYRIDQVRNLIADWVVREYDYLFAVDSDMIFPSDTLERLLRHDKDVITGIYKQRFDEDTIEIHANGHRLSKSETLALPNPSAIDSCGFGCVLIKKQVFVSIGYPQFEYHVALNHNDTISEDTDFCQKARKTGHTVWVDNTIICGHKGTKIFNIT